MEKSDGDKEENQEFEDWLDRSDQLPLVVTRGIPKDEEDALCVSDISRFTKFTRLVNLVLPCNNCPVLFQASL